MNIDITLNIRETLNMSLSQYAKHHKLNLTALRHVIYNPSKPSNDKKSNQYKAKKQLVKDGFLNKSVLELEKRVTYKMRAKERKKIIVKLRREYGMSIKDFYIKNEDYFKKNKIDLSYFYVFLSGIGTGNKPGTKAFYINEFLKEKSLIEA